MGLAINLTLAMASVFLLVKAPDLRQRRTVNAAGVKRRRLFFPGSGYLPCLLEAHNVQHETRQSNYEIFGLASAKPGVALRDVLAICNRQELRVWNGYFKRPADGYTVQITERFIFKQPMPIHTCLRRVEGNETQPLDTRNFPLAPFVPKSLQLCDFADVAGCLRPGQPFSQECAARVALDRWLKLRAQNLVALPVLSQLRH